MKPGLRVEISSAQKSGQLTGFIIPTGLNGMLYDKDFTAIHMVTPFIAALIFQTTGCSDEPKLATIRTIYLDLVNYLMFKSCGVIDSRVSSYNWRENIQKLETVAKYIFENLEDKIQPILKIQMLDHLVKYKGIFELLCDLGSFP